MQQNQVPESAALPEASRVDEGVTLDQIFATFRRRLWLILTIVVLGTSLATMAGHLVTPHFTATAALVIDPADSRLVDTVVQTSPALLNDPGAVQTQIGLIRSRSHLRRAMEHILEEQIAGPLVAELAGTASAQGSPSDSSQPSPEEMSALYEPSIDDSVGSEARAATASAPSSVPGQAAALSDEVLADVAAAEEREAISQDLASQPTESELATLGLADAAARSDDARLAAAMEEAGSGPLEGLASLLPHGWLVAVGLAQQSEDETEEPVPLNRDAVDRFASDLVVEQVGTSAIITISYTSVDPEEAAQIANGVADSYLGSQIETKQEAAGRAAGWLKERVEELRQSVRRSEQAAAQFASSRGLVVGPASVLTNERLLDLDRQLVLIRSEKVEKEAKLRRARALQTDAQEIDALAEIIASPLLLDLRSQEVALLRKRAELAQTYGDRHPKIVDMRAELTELQNKMQRERERAIRSLDEEITVLAGRERAITEAAEELKAQIVTDQRSGDRLRELEREVEANRQLFVDFLTRLKAAEKQMQISTPDVRVISKATVPLHPSTPGVPIFAMIGFVVSATFGSFIAFLLERLDRRLRGVSDIEDNFGVRVLGLMPRLTQRALRQRPDHYLVDKPFSDYAEASRSVLTSLRLSEGDASSTVMLVTSALPNEGKSTFAVSLATTATHAGVKVLLIDLDLRRPSLASRLAGQRNMAVGLVDFLSGEIPLENVIQREPKTGVYFIAGGRLAANPLELMQSAELKNLIQNARREYGYIILDSAPVLAVSDARVATRLADEVVLIGRWQRTDIAAVGHALRSIFAVGAKLAGCVITMVNLRKYKQYASDAGSYYSHYKEYRRN